MAVVAAIFAPFFAALTNKEVDLLDDAIKCMLTTSTYTPAQDTHDYKNDVTNEVSGAGYTATGVTLANDTFSYNAGTNTYTYDADDAVWAGSTITARRAVVYDSTPGTDATRPLICYQSSDADIVSSGGEFRVQWHANGIFTITVGAEA